MSKKVCEQCHTPKELDEFYRSGTSKQPDGRMRMCIQCYKDNLEEGKRRGESSLADSHHTKMARQQEIAYRKKRFFNRYQSMYVMDGFTSQMSFYRTWILHEWDDLHSSYDHIAFSTDLPESRVEREKHLQGITIALLYFFGSTINEKVALDCQFFLHNHVSVICVYRNAGDFIAHSGILTKVAAHKRSKSYTYQPIIHPLSYTVPTERAII